MMQNYDKSMTHTKGVGTPAYMALEVINSPEFIMKSQIFIVFISLQCIYSKVNDDE